MKMITCDLNGVKISMLENFKLSVVKEKNNINFPFFCFYCISKGLARKFETIPRMTKETNPNKT